MPPHINDTFPTYHLALDGATLPPEFRIDQVVDIHDVNIDERTDWQAIEFATKQDLDDLIKKIYNVIDDMVHLPVSEEEFIKLVQDNKDE